MNRNPFNLKFLLVGAIVWNSPLLAPYLGLKVIPAIQVVFLFCGVMLLMASFNKKILGLIKNDESSIDVTNNACKFAGIVSVVGSLALFYWK